MQKVITICGVTNFQDGVNSMEIEYPTLQKYLDDGYKIQDKVLAILDNPASFTITFILHKPI